MGKSRLEEHQAFFTFLLQTIKDKKIELLLVAGDIFDTGTPANYALELYYNFLKDLSLIPTLTSTIITAGNHDSISTLKAPKELLKALKVEVIVLGDEEENEVIPIYKNKELQAIVCAVPFLRDAVIRQAVSGQTLSQKEELTNTGIKAYYENTYKKALKLKQDKNIPIIATGHLTCVGSRTSDSERDIYIGGTLDIGGDYLASMFDYVALGHLHINQTVGNNHVRYSGSPIPLSFSEAKNTQKINIIDFTNKDIEVEEIEVPLIRKLILVKGDKASLQKSLKNIEDKNAWIEVHIKDDNALLANEEIREQASKLELILLAVKIDKSEKQLKNNALKAISLEDLSIEDVFEKRLDLEEIKNKDLKEELNLSFKQVLEKVQKR